MTTTAQDFGYASSRMATLNCTSVQVNDSCLFTFFVYYNFLFSLAGYLFNDSKRRCVKDEEMTCTKVPPTRQSYEPAPYLLKVTDLDKNILGKDEDVANQIRSATQMARWCMKHQVRQV